jgi:protocatechuate 3,4-dioxygenase, beta subunit
LKIQLSFFEKIDMKIPFCIAITFFLLQFVACQVPSTPNVANTEKSKAAVSAETERHVGGPCECCEAIFDGMPETLVWETQIAKPGEPGEPLEVSGTIFKSDGKTPAEGIILYVYHTDNQGLYSKGPTSSKCAERHGHLRAWIKTGSDGRYLFRTIRPANYPGTNFEQHIHPIIKEVGMAPYWIDEFVFNDDSKLTTAMIAKHQNRGGSGIMNMLKNGDGVWIGQRDIFLGKNVPGY